MLTIVTAARPLRPIPGSYGLPVIGPLKDRLDYFCFQGPDIFFRKRAALHGTTVFRTNLPPTFPDVDTRVIALLDCASFPTLFDASLVSKSDVLLGDYVPDRAFTGGTRVVVYQDPSEEGHTRGKEFCMELLRRGARGWAAEVSRGVDEMMEEVRKAVEEEGKAGLLEPMQKFLLGFLSKCLIGADLLDFPGIRKSGFAMLSKWLALQLLPTTKIGKLPQPLEEILFHSFCLPFFLVSGDFDKLVEFVKKGGREAVELGREYGFTEEEAVHNILFVLGFNAFGGFSVFFSSLFTIIGKDATGLQRRLREEVLNVLNGRQELGFDAVNEMELVRSTVYEILRFQPPVPLQYARARKDFVLSSHDYSFMVERGELLCGYQPLAMRDPRVFDEPESVVPDRFVGAKGRELLSYLFWSNGPETRTPAAANKQCAAKDYVVATACIVVARIFSNYDAIDIDDSLNVVNLRKAKSNALVA